MSEIRRRLESILIVDCGTTTTKAVLLDLVAGQYHLVAHARAPSTVYEPWQDISVGVVSAIARLQEISGRTFLDPEDQLITPEHADGRGVDRLLVVSSAAQPLRVILAGLAQDVSLSSARRAALSTYATIEDVIALEQSAAYPYPRTDSAKINAICSGSADVILVVGGTEGGAAEPVVEMVRDLLRVALFLMDKRAPRVVYAGNSQLHEEVTQLLDGIVSLQLVDNVRPTVDVEDLAPAYEELDVLFYESKMRSLLGIRRLRSWTPSIILPTARAADYTIRYCERAWEVPRAAVGVDIGSSSVTINVSYDGQSRTTIRTDLGVGYGLLGLLDQVDVDDILRWVPFELGETEARDWFLHKALNPQTIPQTRRDMLLEQAAARELLRLTLADALPGWPGMDGEQAATIPPCEPLIGCGGVLAHAAHPGQAALVLLDALQPLGTSAIYIDEYDLIPALGTVANVEPLATVQVLDSDSLLYVGTVVVPMGHAKPGDRVLTVRSCDPETELNLEVRYGELQVVSLLASGQMPAGPHSAGPQTSAPEPIESETSVPQSVAPEPVAPGTSGPQGAGPQSAGPQSAGPQSTAQPSKEPEIELELVPARGFDVGRGFGKSVRIPYRPGAVGLIIDARGRPLPLDEDPFVQRELVDDWLYRMTGERGT